MRARGGSIFLRKFTRYSLIASGIIVIMTSAFYFWYSLHRSYAFRHTPTTDLSTENINGIYLNESIDDPKFVNQYERGLKKIDNALYDYYELKDGIVIATDKERKIIRIVLHSNLDKLLATSKGIRPGNTLEDVKQSYGGNFYHRVDDQGADVIGYLDREQQFTIEFWCWKDKVDEIRFDKTFME
jgi:hypothetical protein